MVIMQAYEVQMYYVVCWDPEKTIKTCSARGTFWRDRMGAVLAM